MTKDNVDKVEVLSAEEAEEILRKYDPESNTRMLQGFY